MATFKYNPLLKRNLQEINDPFDPSEIESEIADLQQKKVTKFFSATDTLEDGEVAEYQGTDDTVNGLVNGYFYKKNNELPSVIRCCRLYKKVSGLNVNYTEGDYLYNRSEDYGSTINLVSITVQSNAQYRYITVGNSTNIQVGTIIYKSDITEIQNVYAKVVSITDDTYYLDDSTNFTVISKSTRTGSDIYYYKKNNEELAMLQDEYWQPVAAIGFDNGIPYPIIFMPWQPGNYHDPQMIGVYTTVTITPPPFIRIDTQPQPATATTTADGLMTAADKSKLDGIATGANKYTLPTATPSVLGGIKVGAYLAIANGVLSGNYSNATTEHNGLMSAADKQRLNIPHYTSFSSLRLLIESLISSGYYFYRFSVASEIVTSGLPLDTGSYLCFIEYYCRPSASNAVNITARINGRGYNLYLGCFYRTDPAGTEATWQQLILQPLS